ncbi:MAG: signal peptidase II [Candidatus Shapirobacteria bacterium]|nr:signal peptidase II [Candidatus Shapirobacteria bacterium]
MKKKKKLSFVVILSIWLLGELVHFSLASTNNIIKNYGISFGINGGFFIILNIIFVVILTKIWFKNNLLSLGLMSVGGWINLIDRLIFGYVRDYWYLGRVYNNLADWLIQIGIIIFLSELWIKKLK